MVQNGRISDCHGLLTLTLDPGQGHTVVHLSSSTICIPNFIEIEETFCGRTDGKLPPIVLGRLPKFGSRPKNVCLNGLQRKNKYDLIWSSITLSNCSDNVKTTIQETNWDSCPIQAEHMSMKQTLRNSQYSIEGHIIFSSPPKISMTQLASFPPRFGRPCSCVRFGFSALATCLLSCAKG